MYKKIMVPVDLAHIQRLGKAIDSATDLAKLYGLPICFVGVTVEAPSAVAHNPAEFSAKLKAFGETQSQTHGLTIETKAVTDHDPAADLHLVLIGAAKDIGADLIIMASHVPGLAEHIFASNAGAVASHAEVSVFVVR